jgi:hypothetical protein
LCYNTGHEFTIRFNAEFDREFVPEFVLSRDCAGKSEEGRFRDLSQLLDRVARSPLQGGLQEMRLLFELLRFLLKGDFP